ncbi:beta-lactamase [Athelia psychrophila]|uniref:Beta-lactamase n=1 Tax=Athelia psychrophila TaxID=1759441 RepID=A0A166AB26_9AGAM|nr:beta-lactamase [Fibularhizoctonia sp. CBS 109695]
MSLEDIFRAAVENKTIPGAVLVATNRSGTLNYAAAFGNAGASPDSTPLAIDSVFWIASCTKLLTTIAALQCVERGLFALDAPADVAHLLPEYVAPVVLAGFDARGEAIINPAARGITLRHLLTHTGGMGYDTRGPLAAWRGSRGEKPARAFQGDIAGGMRMPLLFEPGEGWNYGTGVDWAGKMVERANRGMSLDVYMRENLWEPLGLRSMTFHLEQREDIRGNLVEMARRTPESGALVPSAGHIIANPSKDAMGGIGLYGSAEEYLQILASLLRDDGKLLTSQSVTEMFAPQLSPACKEMWMRKVKARNYVLTGGLKIGADLTWGLGGLCTLEDVEGRRKKGSLSWGGLPNLFWWIDRESGVAGMYASQVLPQGDPLSCELFAEFEKYVYKNAEELTLKG